MKYILFILFSLLALTGSTEDNCLTTKEILTEACKKKLRDYYLTKEEGYLEEEHINNEWTVKVMQHEQKSSKWGVYASVNGIVTDGDRIRIRILTKDLNSCNIGNTITTFYTMVPNAKILNFSNEVIPAKFKNNKINIELLFANRFLSGYSVTVDLGWNELDSIKEYFKDTKEVTLKLLDSENIKIKDYFDIDENVFSLQGLNNALDRAKGECIRIVNNREG